MATIKKILDKQGNEVYLRTHTKAVVDDNGYTVESRLQAKQDEISNVSISVDNNTGTPSGSVSFNNNTLAFSFQNLKGATGAQGPQGIQGVQGERGPVGANGVTSEANIAIITGIDTTTTYDSTTDVASAEAVQDVLKMFGTVYYVETT